MRQQSGLMTFGPLITRRPQLLLMVLVVFALFASACGTDTEPQAEPPEEETDTAAEPTPTEEEGGEQEETAAEETEEETEAPADHGTVSIRLNWIPGGHHVPFFYGVAQGFYEEEGITFDILEGRGSQLAIEDVAAGNVDFAMAGAPPALIGISQGRELISVATPLAVGSYGFFADEDSDIQSIEDLEGRSILITPGSPETPLLPAVFALAGVSEAAVQYINVEAAAKLSAYVNGEGDAMATTIPFYNSQVQPIRPSQTFLFNDVGFVMPDYSFLVHLDTLEERPDMIEAWLRATMRSWAAAMDDPEGATQAMADARSGEVDYDLELQAWQDHFDHICSEGMSGMQLGRHAEEEWQAAMETLQEYSGLEGELDLDRFITNQFFDEGEPIVDRTC